MTQLSQKPIQTPAVKRPSDLIRIEAEALEQLAQRLEGPQSQVFEQVAALFAQPPKAAIASY